MACSSTAKRAYGLPAWVAKTDATICIKKSNNSLLLPMAYTPGSPAHPAYGAGHATVAGACVTMLKAYFKTLDCGGEPIKFNTLKERDNPYGASCDIKSYVTGVSKTGAGTRTELTEATGANDLTIEGELNKLAMNVAMGRSIGGVHWRTDNTRSLMLGEAIAAQILADITVDCNESPYFVFRSFARNANGAPKTVSIRHGRVTVDGTLARKNMSAL